jgi:hypothetical protein
MHTIPESVVLNKKGHKILSPEGLVSFYGINKIQKDKYIHLHFTNGNELKCSLDHPLSTIEGIIKAKNLDVYTEVYTKDGGCFLVESKIVEEPIELYDIVNSGTKHLYYSNNIISHNCEFLGSVDTLIAPSKLRALVYDHPLTSSGGLDVHTEYIENNDYLITVDVARGVGNDYSAFTVVDITTFPHQVVAKYRNNEIKPMLFPSIIVDVAKNYNNAYILCEVNDVGDQVASIIHYDLEYNNLLMCSMRGRAGQIVGQGFSGKKTQLGVKMSKTVKKIGCLNLKTMIEENKLLFNDYDIMSELTTFIQKHNSFEAEEGCNDDLAMCLVIYAWLVAQDYFKELTDQDVRKRLYEEQKNQIEQDMSPFGFIVDGTDDNSFVDNQGDRWFTDEYGDRSYMWEYLS